MSKVKMVITFKLAEGKSVENFLLISKRLNDEFMSKQKGYVSWEQAVDGDLWLDILTWETIEDAKNVDQVSCTDELSNEYFTFLDQNSVKANLFTVIESYE